MDEVESYIKSLLAQKIKQAKQIDKRYADLIKQVRILVDRGGKRLRPKLVLEAYKAYGGINQSKIIKIAASQELFHAYILMHDDIIDRDLIRWGGPNISGHYLNSFEQKVGQSQARHYADSWALLAGDLCFSLAFEAIIDSGFEAPKIIDVVRLVQDTQFTMIGGEVVDTILPLDQTIDSLVNELDFLSLCIAKTSVYTFCTPLRLGAMLAGASRTHDKNLFEFGRQIGIAFQLRDDMLDIFGNVAKIGKSTLSDIREGKRTLLMSTAFKMANPVQHDLLKTIIGNPLANLADLEVVKDILRATGALEYTNQLVQHYCYQANHIIMNAAFPVQLSSYLTELVAFCADREV